MNLNLLRKLPAGWKRIYLCRHGETEANAHSIIQGSGVDHQLNEKGVSQAEKLAELLSPLPIDRFYSSRLSRSIKTAEIVHRKNVHAARSSTDKVINHDGLNEMYYGDWEGKQIADVFPHIRDISMKWSKGFTNTKCPGNGESPEEVLERANRCLIENILGVEKNLSKTSHICVVAHARLNQILMSHLSGEGIVRMKSFQQGNCCVNVIDYDPDNDSFHVRVMNYCSHLESKL